MDERRNGGPAFLTKLARLLTGLFRVRTQSSATSISFKSCETTRTQSAKHFHIATSKGLTSSLNSGRKLATPLLTLPDRATRADYYKLVPNPIALDVIEVPCPMPL